VGGRSSDAMPIYEFYSPDTHKIYSFYARRMMGKEVLPQCPDGSQHRMERQISRFAFTGKAREPGPAGEEAAPDPRQEAAMMQIASEIESMGEANHVNLIAVEHLGRMDGDGLPFGTVSSQDQDRLPTVLGRDFRDPEFPTSPVSRRAKDTG